MPGHTSLWGPEHFIKALRQTASAFERSGSTLSANECEGAAGMMWKLWESADPHGATAAKPRLFQQRRETNDGK